MSTLDEIEARIADCKTYKFGMRNADTLAHFDAPFLLAVVREQGAKLAAIDSLVTNWELIPALRKGTAAAGIRAALEAQK